MKNIEIEIKNAELIKDEQVGQAAGGYIGNSGFTVDDGVYSDRSYNFDRANKYVTMYCKHCGQRIDAEAARYRIITKENAKAILDGTFKCSGVLFCPTCMKETEFSE